jgi:hypothetical protein
MRDELTLIADKIESVLCQTHNAAPQVKIVRGSLKITCCCEKHKAYLERQAEYELYKLFEKEDEENAEALPVLKRAV